MSIRKAVLVVLSVGILLLVPSIGQAGANRLYALPSSRSPRLLDTTGDLASAALQPYMGNEITISLQDNVKYLPSVAYNSKHQEYLVVWHDTWTIGTRDIRARRISASGQPLGDEFIGYEHPTKDSAQPSVAYDPVNDRYLVVFVFDTSGNGSDWDLYGRFIPWDGPSSSLTAFPIVTWTTSQWNPKVVYARAQEEFFVVWANTYSAGTPPAYVSGKRIYANGSGFPSPLNTSDLTLSHSTENYINPDVSYNLARNEYLVVWERGSGSRDIWAVRLEGHAVPLGGGPFAIADWPDNEEHPAVAACAAADKYLVAWQSDVGTGGANYDMYGRLVNGDGSLDGGPFVIDSTTAPEKEASIACGPSGRQYLVVYQQMYTSAQYGITGRLVSPEHSMEAAFPIVSPGSAANRTNPAVAGGAGNYLVAWEHRRDGTAYQDIHGRLIFPYAVFLPIVGGK